MPRFTSIDDINTALVADPNSIIELDEDQFDAIFDFVPAAADENFYMEYEEAAAFPRDRVWSALDGEDGRVWLTPGFHLANVFAYVVSVHPWPSDRIEVRLDGSDEDTIDE